MLAPPRKLIRTVCVTEPSIGLVSYLRPETTRIDARDVKRPYTDKLVKPVSDGSTETSRKPRKQTSGRKRAPSSSSRPTCVAEEASAPGVGWKAGPGGPVNDKPSTVRFDLMDGPNNASIPRIVVDAAPAVHLTRTQYLEKSATAHQRRATEAQWARECAALPRLERRDSLDGLAMIKCQRRTSRCSQLLLAVKEVGSCSSAAAARCVRV
ncbi:hypothetical protein LTR53_002714 [Teratosphaeriaceae sp. CCFEE 6253]|nr:hypothetical protein LTR53_002714 [Teratosphaeriaceae sp. CCFEE 6253]